MTQPLQWGQPQEEATQKLKDLLIRVPALELPNPSKPFQLYLHERNGIALGVLTQRLGPTHQPVGYLSK